MRFRFYSDTNFRNFEDALVDLVVPYTIIKEGEVITTEDDYYDDRMIAMAEDLGADVQLTAQENDEDADYG